MPDVAQLCTLNDIKQRMAIRTTDQDELIQSLIDTVLVKFNMRYSREFMPQVEETRMFRSRRHFVVCEGCDLRTVTSITINSGEVEEKVLTAGVDYTLDLDDYDTVTKTYSLIRLSNWLDYSSNFLCNFDYAKVEIAGAWGCWSDVSDVPADVRAAAVETVAAWMNKPAQTIANMFSSQDPRDNLPQTPQTWDIPTAAYQTMKRYDHSGGGVG